MGFMELAAFSVVLAVAVYAYTRRSPPGELGWHSFGYGRRRPLTVWEVLYVISSAVVLVWLLRIGHLLCSDQTAWLPRPANGALERTAGMSCFTEHEAARFSRGRCWRIWS